MKKHEGWSFKWYTVRAHGERGDLEMLRAALYDEFGLSQEHGILQSAGTLKRIWTYYDSKVGVPEGIREVL